MKKSIDLEYSYIDLNASTISINPSQSPQRPVSKKNGVDDRSPRISKQDSFTVLTESMLQGFEGSHGSDRKSDASSNKSRASLLLRPSRSRRAPEKTSLLTETQHRERLFEIFKDWTRQNTLPSVLCSPCVSGLYEMSSEQLQRAVKEFKQLHNYRSTSCTSLVDPSFVSNAVRQLAEQHERQELQYDVSALSEDSERLQQEIRLLEQKREITAQLMKAQHREVVKLRQQLQNDGSSGSDELFLDDALDKAESDVSRKLQLLTATYCEEKLWGSRVTLAPLFDDIQTFPTNISTTTSTAPTTSPTSSSTPSSPLPNTSKPDDSYDDSFLATAKKLFARHRKKSDDPTTSTPDTSACVSTTSAEYAVINGHRVSVVPIPKILLNWEEINTAHSLYCSHLLALHRTLPPSTSSSSSSDVLRCGEVVRCLPRLTYAIQRLLSLSRLSIYSSLLKDLQESRRVRQELRLLPLSDRALLSLRCSGREGSGEEVWQETLHLEGGVTMTWHNGLLYREDRGGGSGSGSGGGDVKLVRESATSHYSRAVLAVVVAAVVIQLEYLEHSLSDVTGRLSGKRTPTHYPILPLTSLSRYDRRCLRGSDR